MAKRVLAGSHLAFLGHRSRAQAGVAAIGFDLSQIGHRIRIFKIGFVLFVSAVRRCVTGPSAIHLLRSSTLGCIIYDGFKPVTFLPKQGSYSQWFDALALPGALVSSPVKLTVMEAAERDGNLSLTLRPNAGPCANLTWRPSDGERPQTRQGWESKPPRAW
jgi:hypothetical protein